MAVIQIPWTDHFKKIISSRPFSLFAYYIVSFVPWIINHPLFRCSRQWQCKTKINHIPTSINVSKIVLKKLHPNKQSRNWHDCQVNLFFVLEILFDPFWKFVIILLFIWDLVFSPVAREIYKVLCNILRIERSLLEFFWVILKICVKFPPSRLHVTVTWCLWNCEM